MARTRSGFGRGSHGTRRKTGWELGPGGDDLATLDVQQFTASGEAILGSGIIPTLDGLTLVRTRGFAEFVLSGATTALDGFSWGFGICVVNADAFAVGITAVPKPFTDAAWDGWLYHELWALHSPIAGVSNNSANNTRREIDSKAMRKIGQNDVVCSVVEVGETGAATLNVRSATRVLIKLP